MSDTAIAAAPIVSALSPLVNAAGQVVGMITAGQSTSRNGSTQVGFAIPTDAALGVSTLNIGLISGGRAANVIPDHAKAELMIRLVDDGLSTREALRNAVNGNAELHEILAIPAVHLGWLPGFDTTVVSFTTDIPALGAAWGKPYLLGPGTIHVAHTAEERVPKQQLLEAVQIYKRMVKQLTTR